MFPTRRGAIGFGWELDEIAPRRIDPSDRFPGGRRKQWTSNGSSGEGDQPAAINERTILTEGLEVPECDNGAQGASQRRRSSLSPNLPFQTRRLLLAPAVTLIWINDFDFKDDIKSTDR